MNIEERVERSRDLIIKIAQIGRRYFALLPLREISLFEHYFDDKGNLIREKIDRNDGLWTRREIIARYLLLNAVLDQGPDSEGVRLLLRDVLNFLYQKEVRILHRPLYFFKELGISIDTILQKHSGVKEIRARDWARENNSSPSKYNLFFTQSTRGIVSTKQVLDYGLHRWGVPLCLFLLLERDSEKKRRESTEPFVEFLESYPSAEIASRQLKNHERYGLGSEIGDKACHLFIKWYLYSFKLAKRRDDRWGPFSYELPFDSNVGRVLFRTGFLLNCAAFSRFQEWNVIQEGRGKGGKNYLRVTNIRNKISQFFSSLPNFLTSYQTLAINYLGIKKEKPSKIEIQHIPALLLLETEYEVGDLDNGLMVIGTNYCLNSPDPSCRECPIKDLCLGYQSRKDLIGDYTT